MQVIIWSVVLLLAAFSATAVVLVFREVHYLRSRREMYGVRSLSRRLNDYIGPIDRSDAPLNAPLRVSAEFLSALAGFPGIGWMVSGRINVGLPLFVVVPVLLWMLYPLYISTAGIVLHDPLRMLTALPVLATASAGTLAVLEFRSRHAQ